MPTRRALLLGGAGIATAGLVGAGVGIEQGLLPGRPWLQRQLGLNGDDGVVPDVEPGRVVDAAFVSEARGGVQTGWSLIRPPAVDDGPLPLVVALHGLGADHSSLTLPQFGLDRFLAAYVNAGGPPFAIVAPDGGTSYWHPHGGEDAGAMVTDELLPMLEDRGYDTSTVGLLGWSMGGYGALRLAGLLGAGATSAVVAVSPALWNDPTTAPPTGFANPEEADEFTVVGRQDDLEGIPIRVDIGTGDPFYRIVQDYVDAFPEEAGVVSTFQPGGHTVGYWRRMLPAQLRFLGKHV